MLGAIYILGSVSLGDVEMESFGRALIKSKRDDAKVKVQEMMLH